MCELMGHEVTAGLHERRGTAELGNQQQLGRQSGKQANPYELRGDTKCATGIK